MPDTRPFSEVYKSLTRAQRAEFRLKVMRSSLVTDSAIRNWACGHRIPAPVHQAIITKVFKSFKIETSPATLFPDSKIS